MSDKPSRIRVFTGELRRRHVFQVGFAYLAIAYVTLEGASFVLPALHVPPWVMTVLVVLGLIGFPVALVLGWIFDLSPEGVVRTEPAIGWHGGVRTHGRAAAEREATHEVHPRKAIAVLPFANVSGDRDNEYFSDGITEEIIVMLSKISDLRVVSRTTAMACKGTTKTLRELGRDLRVGTIVEGSVRKAGQRVRIVSQLVDARSDDRLWGETYDRELKDIFEIQTDVARRIATALHAELSMREERSIAERPTGDLVAYDLYLRARHAWNQRTEDGIERSVRYLDQAIAADPGFALAHAGLADSYVTLGIYNAHPPADVMPKAIAAADRALGITPGLAAALAARGTAKALYDWDWAGADRDFLAAVELDPRYATAHQWRAMHSLTPTRRLVEAHEELEKARALEPASPVVNVSIAFVHYLERAYDRAEATLRDVLEWDPRFAMAHYFLGQVQERTGGADEAIASFERAAAGRGRTPEIIAALAQANAIAGRSADSRALLDELRNRSRESYVSPTRFAQIHTALGEPDEAFQWLARACTAKAADLIWIACTPAFDPLRDDARFTRLLGRLRLEAR